MACGRSQPVVGPCSDGRQTEVSTPKRRRFAAAALAFVLAASMLGTDGARGQTLPGVPTIDEVTAGSGSLTVAWTAPSETGGSTIDAYDLRWIAAAATDRTDSAWTLLDNFWTSGDLSGEVTDLSNGTEYDLQLRAVTDAGDGPWSAESSATPQIAAPTITALVPSDKSVTVAWMSLAEEALGSAVALDVRWIRSDASDKSDSEWSVASRVGASPRHHIIGELTNDTGYDVQARTVADGQEGPWSTTEEATPYEPASSPQATQAAIRLGVPIAAEIADASDIDVFRLVLPQSSRLLIRTTSDSLDSECKLIDADGDTVNNGDISGNNNDGQIPGSSQDQKQCVIAITPPSDSFPATLYVSVEPNDGSGSYVLHVDAPPDPGTSIAGAVPIESGEVKAGGHSTATDDDYLEIAAGTDYLILSVYYPDEPKLTLLDSESTRLDERIDLWMICPDDCEFIGVQVFLSPASKKRYVKIEPPEGFEELRLADYYFALGDDTEYTTLLAGCRAESRPSGFDDDLSGCQWHLDNRGQLAARQDEDANVAAAHAAGYLGAGVQAAVVDQGFDISHPDLSANSDTARSRSFCGDTVTLSDNNDHGTAVAGLLAARDNSVGVRGVAPRATLHNFRLLGCSSGNASDANVAAAMTQDKATVAVSSNSWALGGASSPRSAPTLWDTAVTEGVTSGFGGKGVSYVWAGGNDHGTGGYSNLDGLANHYAVIAVCAVNSNGERAHYSEKGPNLWVCAPSHGRDGLPGLTTTTNYNRYRTDFGGTSGAVPIVSGVVALMRAANSSVTWRDVKLILAASARRNDPDDGGWTEGARQYRSDTGRYWFSHDYGFGVVDAHEAVKLSNGWTSVPALASETVTATDTDLAIPDDNSTVTTSVTLTDAIEFVEHVEVKALFDADEFRSLDVELVSPSSTTSLLSPSLSRCCALTEQFRFGSSRHLGEPAVGEWTLRVTDRFSGGDAATLESWSLTLRGHRLRPSAPRAPMISSGAGTLTITWTAPTKPGVSAITGYDVRYIRADATDRSASAWRTADDVWTSGTLTHTLSGLGARAWDVQIRAFNDKFKGAWSAAVEGTPTMGANAEPYFSPTATERSVDENTAAGTPIGSPVAAVDDDADATLTYSLAGTDASHFAIETASGQIKTKSSLDHESKASYSVTVSVHDGRDLSGSTSTSVDDSADVTINVTGIDESPEISGPTAPTLDEGDTLDVGVFEATDPEGEDVTLSLSGEDSDDFDLAGDGTLSFTMTTDYEFPTDADGDNAYEVSIDATDGTQPGRLDVVVSVADVNEPPTLRDRGCSFTLRENATSAWQCAFDASDPEQRPINWSLSGDDDGEFTLSGSAASAVLQTLSDLGADYETRTAYAVVVTATDDGGHTAAQSVTLEVTDVDEPGSASIDFDGALQPGTTLDASVFDDDCGRTGCDASWEWQRSHDSSDWSVIAAATAASYTLTEDDACRQVRLRAVYTDSHGDQEVFGKPGTAGELIRPITGSCRLPADRGRGGNGTHDSSDGDDKEQQPVTFTDVDPSGVHSAGIAALAAAGIASGCGREPPRYCPGQPVTRAQMASFLARALNLDLDLDIVDTARRFTDVDPSGVHSAGIAALAAAGIASGCGREPPRYCPGQPVTRAQMASFLARALNLEQRPG